MSDATRPERVLDAEAIDQLHDSLGDDVLGQVLRSYLDELPRYLGDIHRGLAAADATSVARAAHSLKGATRLIGGDAFAALCESIESAARLGGIDSLAARVPELDRMAAEVETAVRARIPR